MVDLQPTLVGETVLIRPLRADDWQAMFAAASDPLIWELHPARDRYQEVVFRKFFDDAIGGKSAFAFVDRKNGALFGSSRYHGYDPALREIEIGWTFLTRDYWGGATNREIKQLMLTHAFGFADAVIFWVGEGNLRSQRAMEKLGGIRRDGLYTRPHATGRHVVFEIQKQDFEDASPSGGQ